MIPHSKPWITDADQRGVEEALASGWVAAGARVRAFEHEVAVRCSGSGGVATSCGTAAITLALRALRLAEAAEVILPAYVCREVFAAVVAAGLTPVLCDVGADGLVDEQTIGAKVGPRTGAIIVVHLFGRLVPMAPIAGLGIPIVEDACQALGARLSGAIGTFSFQATKAVTTGEGGMAVSSDPALVDRMRHLRDGDLDLGNRLATPMSDISAALGLSQLARYDDTLRTRRAIAERYADALRDRAVLIDSVETIREGCAFRFALRSPMGFASAAGAFADAGIAVRRGVDALLHRDLGLPSPDFPVAEQLFAETLSVPLYPALSSEEIEHITHTLTRIFPERA